MKKVTDTTKQRMKTSLVATYENYFEISNNERMTEYFGDYGDYFRKAEYEGFNISVFNQRVNDALNFLGLSEDAFISNSDFLYRGNIRKEFLFRYLKTPEATFLNACLTDKAGTEDLNDCIEYWHTHNIQKPLQEFLGLTDAEYNDWAKSSDSIILKFILTRKTAK